MVAMKRAKLSHGTQVGSTNEHSQRFIPFTTYLPLEIIGNILLKLSTRSLISCKCTCKTFYDLVSDSHFIKLHLAQSKVRPLVRDMYPSRLSRTLYLIEPENGRDFDSGYCWFGNDSPCPCPSKTKVKSKLKIPLQDALVLFDEVEDLNIDLNDLTFHSRIISKRKPNLVKVETPEVHKYLIVNSCNGLLCLMEKFGDHPLIVCNPTIGQYIYLPTATKYTKKYLSMGFSQEYLQRQDNYLGTYGLGFSPKNNEYKVIRIMVDREDKPNSGTMQFIGATWGEIYTIGTKKWRSKHLKTPNFSAPLSSVPLRLHCFATYHYGALHRVLAYNTRHSYCILFSVDLDKEKCYFHTVKISQRYCLNKNIQPNLALGVLGDCLCLYDNFYGGSIDIRVMKDNDVWKSWTTLFSIGIGHGLYQPISYLQNGALLMFNSLGNELIYYDHLGSLRYKYLKVGRLKSKFEVIAFTPSLISLKDILMDSNIKVLNINSRCGKIKFLEETHPFFLGRSKS